MLKLILVFAVLHAVSSYTPMLKKCQKFASSVAVAAGVFGGAGNIAVHADNGIGIKRVEETQRPFNELSPSAQRRFAIGLCKDKDALKKAGFEAYNECTASVFDGDFSIVTGEGAEKRTEKRKAAATEGKSLAPSTKFGFDFSGGSKDESSQALKPNAGGGKGKTKGLQPKKLTEYQKKEIEKSEAIKKDPLFEKLNRNSFDKLPIIE